jgi:hypothetical protein
VGERTTEQTATEQTDYDAYVEQVAASRPPLSAAQQSTLTALFSD